MANVVNMDHLAVSKTCYVDEIYVTGPYSSLSLYNINIYFSSSRKINVFTQSSSYTSNNAIMKGQLSFSL